MSDLIGPTGCRNIKYLSGKSDEDSFLTQSDMSKGHWSLLMSCYHSGACDDDCDEAAKYFEIKDDEGYVSAVNYLIDAGIDRDKLVINDCHPDTYENLESETVLKYYLWMLSGDIQDAKND